MQVMRGHIIAPSFEETRRGCVKTKTNQSFIIEKCRQASITILVVIPKQKSSLTQVVGFL